MTTEDLWWSRSALADKAPASEVYVPMSYQQMAQFSQKYID